VINQRLRSIRKYYDYLQSEGHFVPKLENIRVKGVVKKVLIDPLGFSDLEQLYTDYSAYRKSRLEEHGKNFHQYKAASLRRKVMIGLLVFQGLRSSDLKRLEISHINDEKGTIYIPATLRSSSRELKLQSSQMRTLFKLLTSLEDKQASLLFSNDVDNQLFHLLQELRGLNQKVQNATHIRASVIMHWLKLHGKRQVQYMIGHKWISSTEHYEIQDLETLTNQLEKHHPLRGLN
jgi:site-specific recombinase XerD